MFFMLCFVFLDKVYVMIYCFVFIFIKIRIIKWIFCVKVLFGWLMKFSWRVKFIFWLIVVILFVFWLRVFWCFYLLFIFEYYSNWFFCGFYKMNKILVMVIVKWWLLGKVWIWNWIIYFFGSIDIFFKW